MQFVATRVIGAAFCICFQLLSFDAFGDDGARPEHGLTAVIAALDAYNRGDIGFAYRVLRAEADQGDADAQVNLGYLYARGQGVARNQREAFRLYGLSAAQGNGEGMNALGFKYQFGTGIKPDINKAVHWYCMAVVRGNPRAMNNLAALLYDGKAIPMNRTEAHNLWQQAAERDHVNAMYNLGVSYLYGPDQPIDPDQGRTWILKAARRGHAGAQQVARKLGYVGPFPRAVDFAAQMELQPKNAAPGHAVICGNPIS